MADRNPSVVTGARGPRGTNEAEESSDPTRAVTEIPENEVWYQARYSRLRIQLTAPQDQRLPDGRVKVEAPIVAQFNQAFLKLNLDRERDRKTHELLQDHQNLGVTFWNFQDALDEQKRAERQRAIEPLRDPEQRRLILEQLKAEGVDFELPKAPGKATSKKQPEVEADSD